MPTPTVFMPPRHYLNDGYGIKSWLLTRDHKRIALLYLASVTFFFFVGGAMAVLIRLDLATPAHAEACNHLSPGYRRRLRATDLKSGLHSPLPWRLAASTAGFGCRLRRKAVGR